MLAAIDAFDAGQPSAWLDPWGYVLVAIFLALIAHLGLHIAFRIVGSLMPSRFGALFEALRQPMVPALWLGAGKLVARFALDAESEWFDVVALILDIALITLFGWFVVRFIKIVEVRAVRVQYHGRHVDRNTAMIVGNLARAAVIVSVVLVVLESMGFSLAGVLTIGGMSGVIIGYMAKDLFDDYLSALVLFWDRPFGPGEVIRLPEADILGTVEEIGWNDTILRTPEQRPLHVPNSLFATQPVETISRMLNRRIREVLRLRHQDIDVVVPILEDVRTMLAEHDGIDHACDTLVRLVSLSPSSLDVLLVTYTKTIDRAEFHLVQQDILLRIAHIVRSHGARLAPPVRAIHPPRLMLRAGLATRHAR